MNKKDLVINNRKDGYKLLKRYIHNTNKYNIVNNTNDDEINHCIKATNITNKSDRNDYIYDVICNILDDKWNKYSPCKFCNNKCIASRNNFMDKKYDGCCYSFKRKRFGKVNKEKCIHLKHDKSCDTKNISCKLFTCDYLKKKKIFSTEYDDYLLLKLFFNKKEKLIIKYNFFKTKEEVLNKLNEINHKPYILYLLSFDFVIK